VHTPPCTVCRHLKSLHPLTPDDGCVGNDFSGHKSWRYRMFSFLFPSLTSSSSVLIFDDRGPSFQRLILRLPASRSRRYRFCPDDILSDHGKGKKSLEDQRTMLDNRWNTQRWGGWIIISPHRQKIKPSRRWRVGWWKRKLRGRSPPFVQLAVK